MHFVNFDLIFCPDGLFLVGAPGNRNLSVVNKNNCVSALEI